MDLSNELADGNPDTPGVGGVGFLPLQVLAEPWRI